MIEKALGMFILLEVKRREWKEDVGRQRRKLLIIQMGSHKTTTKTTDECQRQNELPGE